MIWEKRKSKRAKSRGDLEMRSFLERMERASQRLVMRMVIK